jgi:S1-C subfamily serine protease
MAIATAFVTARVMYPPKTKTVIEELHNASVVIRTNGSTGSGTIFNRGGRSFVWTAGHVVDGGIDGVTVIHGIDKYKARVIRYSSIGNGRDLALLEVDGFIECKPIHFRKSDVKIGMLVTHIGSIFGTENERSVSRGTVASPSRFFRIGQAHNWFDQYDITAYPGCSGGGLFSGDQYVGMLTLGRRGTEAVHFCVPSSEIVKWAIAAGVPWAVDYTSPVPSEIIPLFERSDTTFGKSRNLSCGFKTMIGKK